MDRFIAYLKAVNPREALAFLIVICILAMLSFIKLPDNVSTSLINILVMIAGFYFGSSKSSAGKDKTIAEMTGPSVVASTNSGDIKT